jgi:hypothetical protein
VNCIPEYGAGSQPVGAVVPDGYFGDFGPYITQIMVPIVPALVTSAESVIGTSIWQRWWITQRGRTARIEQWYEWERVA